MASQDSRKLSVAFVSKRSAILQALAQPSGQYQDASPKGTVDEEIRDLIEQINAYDNCVTTSSCAGRIAVFLEAAGDGTVHDSLIGDAFADAVFTTQEDANFTADSTPSDRASRLGHDLTAAPLAAPSPVSIKGPGGRWLYVSHQPIDLELAEHAGAGEHERPLHDLFGLEPSLPPGSAADHAAASQRYAHFKFEPMILHVLTADLLTAQAVLTAAQQAGFRESGVSSVTGSAPMVAVRTQGLALDSIVGALAGSSRPGDDLVRALVPEDHLALLVRVARSRFSQNTLRIGRFADRLREQMARLSAPAGRNRRPDWEDADERRARKRAEGILRQRRARPGHDGGSSLSKGVEHEVLSGSEMGRLAIEGLDHTDLEGFQS